MSTLGALAVFSGLSLNLLLQFGLGICEIIKPVNLEPKGSEQKDPEPWNFSPHWAILFVSVLVLWFFFTYVLSLPAFGFLESFLLFPAAMVVSAAAELVFAYFFPGGKIILNKPGKLKRIPWKDWGHFSPWGLVKNIGSGRADFPFSYHNGLVLASLFLTLRLAVSPAEALVLSLGFSLGCLAASLILREICRRSSLEAVPEVFRGPPLMLISMGLLSLIFSSVSAIFLRVLGVF